MSTNFNNGYWDSESQGFILESHYNFKKFKPKLKKYFDDGGLYKKCAIAGVMNISNATLRNWLKPDGKYYKRELHQYLDQIRCKSYSVTDEKHRDLAYGRNTDGNAAAMNRRASSILGMNEKIETKQEVKTTIDNNITIDEIEVNIDKVKESIRVLLADNSMEEDNSTKDDNSDE